MSPSGSSAASPQSSREYENREWIYRGAAGLATVILLWFTYRNRYDGAALLFLAPLIAGALIAALRLPTVTGAVDSIEPWLQSGSARAASREGKFAKFFLRPFFGTCMSIWRSTAPVSDAPLRAGVRVTALIFVTGVAIMLLVMAVYIIVAVVVLVLMILFIGWILSLSDHSHSSGSAIRVTRHATDWLGKPKLEHFDDAGHKVGESRPDTDWLGNPKMVHTDTEGKVVGESRPDTDWLGNPKTVHTDTEGKVVGESRPDTDWLGNPKTTHTDAAGNVTGESREEKDFLGQPKTVRYNK